MKAYTGSKCTVPLILKLATRWWWQVQFTPWLLYSCRKSLTTHQIGNWVCLGQDIVEKRKISCLHQDSKPEPFSCRVTTPTTLFWLPHIPGHHKLLYSHSEVRPLTIAGYNRGLNKQNYIKTRVARYCTLLSTFPSILWHQFVRPGNNIIIHSVVDAKSLRTEQGTDSLLAQTCKTNSYVSLSARLYNTKNSQYNFAIM